MAAISYATKEAPKPELGTLKLVSPTSVSMDDRLVNLTNIQPRRFGSPLWGRDQTKEAITEIEKSLPTQPVVIGLDRVLAAVDKSQITTKGTKIQTKAPPIFYSTRPAILVMTDGDMIMSPISGTTLKYCREHELGSHPGPGHEDLLSAQREELVRVARWDQGLEAGRQAAGQLQADPQRRQLARGEREHSRQGNQLEQDADDLHVEPAVRADRSRGKPKFKKIKDTKLEYATNTESELFHMKEKKGDYYYLTSGRWFSSENPEGPWVFATPNLPPDFQNIPIDHLKAGVRASVPGTDEAAEAVLLASILQTARVNAKEIKAPDVTYDGEPEFKAIEGSTVTYAANSSYDVVRVENHYYLCYQAVWFASTAPTGPWTLCTSIPVEIANLPSNALPSSTWRM